MKKLPPLAITGALLPGLAPRPPHRNYFFSGGEHFCPPISPYPMKVRIPTINGPGAKLLTVRRDTGGNYRIFNMPFLDVKISISGMTISNGLSTAASTFRGGIFCASNLTMTDCAIAANCKSVQLRAERDGTKNGRVYVVTLRVRDQSGNATRKEYKVSVPLNQNGTPAVQDVAAQTKTSSCP